MVHVCYVINSLNVAQLNFLDGGFKHFFSIFSPLFGGNDPI